MSNEGKGILGDQQATGEQIREAWEYAALLATREHLKNEEPIVTWDYENSRVVLVPPDRFTAIHETMITEESACVVDH